jgi:hypothetical protein
MHAIKEWDQASASSKWGQTLHNCKVAIKRNQMIINFVRNRLKIGFRCSWCGVDKSNGVLDLLEIYLMVEKNC